MKTILVPLDGSALAEQVLPSVQMLAPFLEAKVQLLLVSEADRQHLLADLAPDAALAAQQGQQRLRLAPRAVITTQHEHQLKSWPILRQHAEDYLAPLAAQLRAAGVETSYDVRL